MTYRNLSCVLAGLLISNAALANVYDLDYSANSGNGDPTSQGWTSNTSSNGSGNLVTDYGTQAWQANGNNGRASWRKANLSAAFNAEAAANGWQLSYTARVVSGDYLTNYYSNGSVRFLPVVSLDTNNNLQVKIDGVIYPLTNTGKGDVGYNNYQIFYDPDSQQAIFYFNNKPIATWSGDVSNQNQIQWGNGSSSIAGLANYRSVHFSIYDPISIIETDNYSQVSEKDISTSDSYQVVLRKQPTDTVTVVVDPAAGTAPADKLNIGAGNGVSSALIFTTSNWDQPQTVAINAVQDTRTPNVTEGVVISNIVSSTDTAYDGLSKNIRVNVVENDYRDPTPNLPIFDMDSQLLNSLVYIDLLDGEYLGQPDSALMLDNTTMIVGYPEGHGKPNTIVQRSTDAGYTWNGRLAGTPSNFIDSTVTAPTIHALTDHLGVERVMLLRTERSPWNMEVAYSDDKGLTWSAFDSQYPQFSDRTPGGTTGFSPPKSLVEKRDVNGLPIPGKYLLGWSAHLNGYSGVRGMYTGITHDGGLHWDIPKQIDTYNPYPDANYDESATIDSPDHSKMVRIIRTNVSQPSSLIMYSEDAGETWSSPAEAHPSLSGDRHAFHYAPDGRLLVFFRDENDQQPTVAHGDPVLWVGTFDDIINHRPGQYKIRLIDNKASGNETGYGTIHSLPDNTIVVNTYVDVRANGVKDPDVVSMHFTMADLDLAAQGTALNGVVTSYDYDASIGTSPVTETWIDNTSGSATGSIITDLNANSWQANGTNGRAAWRQLPSQETVDEANIQGWTLTSNMRVTSGDQHTTFYSDGVKRFLPIISLNGNNDLIASLEGGGTYTLVSATGNSAYHDYKIDYTPGSGATFSVDGVVIEANWNGSPNSSRLLQFGNSSSNTDGVSNFRTVEFNIK
ncbi:hypothetical protein [Thalassotalea atypica]|uniref:hypothetical protein n=1 Tax=Thalassotalea atypica TaxID=2054316 RepID=UPI00257382A0|nr:hypothetical protein [Thalassotalea atypica]